MLTGQIKGWPIDLTLDRAQSFASAMVGVRGAVVKDREFYRGFLQQWHEEMPEKDIQYQGD
jgi:fructokinase